MSSTRVLAFTGDFCLYSCM